MAANRINLQNRYEEAVARFGVEQVEQGNEIMVEVEFAREALERVEQGKLPSQHAASYRATLEVELARAAALALVRDNEYLLDLARDDGDLAVAIGRARREMVSLEGSATMPIPGSPEAPIHIGHTAEQQMHYSVEARNPVYGVQSSEEIFKSISLAVAEKIRVLDQRLHDQDSPHFISEDSYVTRNEARAERQFLVGMKAQLDGLEPGGTLDLSRTEIDYGYDPEEAFSDRMSGLEYVPATERSRSEHEGHLESVAPLLDQLRERGVTVETAFSAIEPPSEAERAVWDAEIVADIQLEEVAFSAGQNGLAIPEDCKSQLHLLHNYREGLDNPVKDIENEAELRSALGIALSDLSNLDHLEEEFRNREAKRLADSIANLNRSHEAQRLADNIVSLAAAQSAAPVPGSPEAPIQIGHTVEQQLRYATSEKPQREIMDNNPDPLPLFTELYEDVVRTADSVPIGALHRHAEGRLQQSYAVLALIEQGREIGLLPKEGEFVATGARVQDKRTSRMYPAAHRLPCDLSIKYDGQSVRLTDFFEEGLDKTWIDKNIFGPTDRIHRLANVADQWCEDGGMKTTLVKAANAVLDGKMTARRAMDDIVQPGYAAAIATAREKVERNFSIIERQALSQRIVTIQGQPFRLPDPTALNVKGLSERAAAKDVMERTLAAYSHVSELSPAQRMQSAMAATAIIDNEKRAIAEGGRDRLLPPGMAAIEAEHARREARANLQREMDVIEQLAGKAREATVAANDISRPLSARMSAMNDAMAYGDRMKVAWTALQKERGPQIVERMQQRVRHCGFHGQQQLAELRSSFSAPPRVVRAVASELEDTKDSLLRESRAEQDRRAQARQENIVQFGPRPDF